MIGGYVYSEIQLITFVFIDMHSEIEENIDESESADLVADDDDDNKTIISSEIIAKQRLRKKTTMPGFDDERRVYKICNMSEKILWRENNYAHGCDFPTSETIVSKASNVAGDRCGEMCDSKRDCTHFTWNEAENGTCWLRSGPVSKQDAVPTSNLYMTCGITNLDIKLAYCQKNSNMV